MRFDRPHLWIAFFSGAAVMGVAVVDGGRRSPGPLATVHGRVDELTGSNGCAECHGGWFENMTDSCLECHETIRAQIEVEDGLHGALDRSDVLRCANCHSDHHGETFSIVNALSFRLAGVEDETAFDHERIGFTLAGRHVELECSECHTYAAEPVLPAGAMRYGGLEQDCASCHEDVHEGRFALSCNSCHGQTSFEELHSDGHDERLPLIGGHGDVECRTCHSEGEAHSLEAVARRGIRPKPRACLGCHDSPHAAAFVDGVASLEERAVERSCVVCHAAEHTSFRDELTSTTRRQHARSGFALDVPHETVGCAECHDPALDDFSARYPGRMADDCASCHVDPHGGQFDEGPFAASSCLGCHERHRFEPAAFTAVEHARAALPLEDSHVELDCHACHEDPPPGAPRTFRGRGDDCAGCHDDAHRGFFDPHASALAVTPNGACAACHAATTFGDVDEASFDHARFTGFPVDGAHAQSACESCHERTPEPDPSGRTFGFVAEHFGAVEGCVSCHEDVHAGRFDRPEHPRTVQGRSDCARCHSTVSFRSIERRFGHARWTGFELDGAHEGVDCGSCHVPELARDVNQPTWGRARGNDCADCHEDPHAGQLSLAGEVDCARCHDAEADWVARGFRHNLDSRFPLDTTHAALDCAGCHVAEPLGGERVVRYRPLGTDCVDCHGVHERVLRGAGRRPR